MKKKNYVLIVFACGLLFLFIQFFIFAFQFINGDTGDAVVVFSSGEEGGFGSFFSDYWWSIAGTLLLTGLIVRRITKGPEAMLTLVGVLLWAVQIFSLYESQELLKFILSYIIGIIGISLVSIAGFYDAYLIKTQDSDDNDENK